VQGEHRRVNLHGEVFASAERSADAGEMNAHVGRGLIEARRDLSQVGVQPLRRDVDVDAA